MVHLKLTNWSFSKNRESLKFAVTNPLLPNTFFERIIVGGKKEDSAEGITMVVPKLAGYRVAI
jgi:hypothetical protein